MNTFVYDVEVLRGPQEVEGGWQNPFGMGFGTAVAYDYDRNLYHFFGENDRQKLIDLFADQLVVSFNGIKFDNAVVLGNDYRVVNLDEDKSPINGLLVGKCWSDFDLLLMVVQNKYGLPTVEAAEAKLGDKEVHDGSISLDGLAEGTLGVHKTGHGAHAPELIKQGKWAEVFAYNLHDVRLTRMLYEFWKKHGYLIDRNGTKIVCS